MFSLEYTDNRSQDNGRDNPEVLRRERDAVFYIDKGSRTWWICCGNSCRLHEGYSDCSYEDNLSCKDRKIFS